LNLPFSLEERPPGCYIWGVRGSDRHAGRAAMDEETREQLRALGYTDE
jgi:hypothetical protein